MYILFIIIDFLAVKFGIDELRLYMEVLMMQKYEKSVKMQKARCNPGDCRAPFGNFLVSRCVF